MSRIAVTLLSTILATSSAYAEEKVATTTATTDEKSAPAETESEAAPEPSGDSAEQPITDDTNTQAVSPEPSADKNEETIVPDTDTAPTTAEPAATQPNTPPEETPAPAAPQSPHGLTVEQWASVYERSGMTIKTGGYIGIGGAVLATLGVLTVGTGALGVIANEDKEEAGLNLVRGYLLAGFGLAAVGTGSALMAGGSVRQDTAVRKTNPSAPGPGLGYAAWGTWALGFTFPPATILSYVLSSVQKGQNRMYWNTASTTSALDDSKRSSIRVNLVPIHFQGNKGLALTGQF